MITGLLKSIIFSLILLPHKLKKHQLNYDEQGILLIVNCKTCNKRVIEFWV